jgi:uncharacterized protein (TIGR03492 family)
MQAVWKYSQNCTTIFATGDIVVLLMAYLTGKSFAIFIVSSSAYYEGQMRLPLLNNWLLKSSRCQTIFTRDRLTAEVLQQQGIDKAIFAGYPVMDVLKSTGQNLYLSPTDPVVAMLPGSRLPESMINLGVLLDLAIATYNEKSDVSLQFRLAITPNLLEIDQQSTSPFQRIVTAKGWQHSGDGWLYYVPQKIKVYYSINAFADILECSTIVVGMAGTAIEQAVGLGKPVIQIPGDGPQFTYHFAEAQMRLLGDSVQTIGRCASPQNIAEASRTLHRVLADQQYLNHCLVNGLERVGPPGGSQAIAQTFYHRMLDFIKT